jgi:hypothetical protein
VASSRISTTPIPYAAFATQGYARIARSTER